MSDDHAEIREQLRRLRDKLQRLERLVVRQAEEIDRLRKEQGVGVDLPGRVEVR